VRVVLDACVLYPTVLREILLGVAKARLFEPVWSERILREWVLATAKLGPQAPVIAEGEAAMARASFPRAMQKEQSDIEARLHLPDANDVHVAIGAHADAILTFNARDFPRPVLTDYGIQRRDPDGFLWELFSRHPAQVGQITEAIRVTAERLSGEPMPIRKLMKRVQLPRFGKALEG
jgi:hypothetical protein